MKRSLFIFIFGIGVGTFFGGKSGSCPECLSTDTLALKESWMQQFTPDTSAIAIIEQLSTPSPILEKPVRYSKKSNTVTLPEWDWLDTTSTVSITGTDSTNVYLSIFTDTLVDGRLTILDSVYTTAPIQLHDWSRKIHLDSTHYMNFGLQQSYRKGWHDGVNRAEQKCREEALKRRPNWWARLFCRRCRLE